jgi:hypothetical protein|tara:strand:- start:7612 stop:7746 length:135 start_codon:yes stop_codon:yes gene_type:complete
MKDKRLRRYRSRQGRSDRQYKDSFKALAIAIIGLIITLIISKWI